MWATKSAVGKKLASAFAQLRLQEEAGFKNTLNSVTLGKRFILRLPIPNKPLRLPTL